MAISTHNQGPSKGTLYEVLELILDRGLVIDAFVRVSLLGIEVLTIDARIVVASIDTYLRYAEAVGRVNLDTPKAGVPELIKAHETKSAIEGAVETLGGQLGSFLSQSAQQEPAREPREPREPKEGKR